MINHGFDDYDERDKSKDNLTPLRSYSLNKHRWLMLWPRRCAYSNKWMWLRLARSVAVYKISRICFEFQGRPLETEVHLGVDEMFISDESETFLTVSNQIGTWLEYDPEQKAN